MVSVQKLGATNLAHSNLLTTARAYASKQMVWFQYSCWCATRTRLLHFACHQRQILLLPSTQLTQDVVILSLAPARKRGNATAIVVVEIKLATLRVCSRWIWIDHRGTRIAFANRRRVKKASTCVLDWKGRPVGKFAQLVYFRHVGVTCIGAKQIWSTTTYFIMH